MPRPIKDIEFMKSFIICWLQKGQTTVGIESILKIQYGMDISQRTIERRLVDWGVQRRLNTQDTSNTRAQIAILFRLGYSDEEIAEDMTDDGTPIGKTTVARLRLEMGLQRRMTLFERAKRDQELYEVLKKLLDDGVIEGYGRRHLHQYVQMQGVLCTQDRLYAILHELNPSAVDRRRRRLQSKKGEYIVPGPDYIWSIDGHDKLSPFGIQIYACIDAYSRKIIWCYVGISNRTSHSVVQQYLRTCARLGYAPKLFRADRGTELPLVAEAHFAFSRAANPEVLRVQDCFFFGKSTANQRIESWWQELEMSQLFRWRNFFVSLAHTGSFNYQNAYDRITLLAVYFLRVKEEVEGFIDLWNAHKIRPDNTRANHISGRPNRLYKKPINGAEFCAQPINAELCAAILQDCECWDMDEYLPPATLQWCHDTAYSMGIDLASMKFSDYADDGTPMHIFAYHFLRSALWKHMQEGAQPILTESTVPYGGYDATLARGGALAGVVFDNAEFARQVHANGKLFQVPMLQDPPPGFSYIGDTGNDRGWSSRPFF